MPVTVEYVLRNYVTALQKIYGAHLQSVILYGSYARGDFTKESDVDIMILLDLTETEIKSYRHELSEKTYDFNMDYDLDIKPIAKSRSHFIKWVENYPFYANVSREGMKLYEAA